MGRGAASYPRPDHRWSTEDQTPKGEIQSVVQKWNDHKTYRTVYINVWVFKDMASLQMVNMYVD